MKTQETTIFTAIKSFENITYAVNELSAMSKKMMENVNKFKM